MRIPRMLYLTVLLFIVFGAVSGAVLADGDGHTPVDICHVLGNGNYNLITVDDDAVQAHLDHGDKLPVNGECPPDEEEEEECPEIGILTETNCPEDPGHTPVDICHALGNGNYNLITVDDDAVQAHLDHGDKLPVNGECPPDEVDECDVDPQIASENECPPDDDECEEIRILTDEECPPPNDCEEVELSAVVDQEECPPPDDDDTPRTVVPQAVASGYQIRVWSEIPAGGVGWLIMDGNGTWHMVYNNEGDELPLRTNIEYRDRPNESFEGAPVEYNVPMSALILGPDNHDYNPRHYQAFDWQRYVDTGELVLVGVHYDLHCEWGNAPLVGGVENQVCGDHDNRQVEGD